jgi:predicted ArsR family transcriptional regulator
MEALTTQRPDKARRVLEDPSRARVFELLSAVPDGLDTRQLAERSGLHANTVRWHLATLADAGLVASRPEATGKPGRPRVVYRATADAPVEPENYRLLAGLLASSLARSPDGVVEAEAVGAAWGAQVVDGPAPGPDEAARSVVRLLADEGFRPELAGGELRMRRCPFHDLALTHGQVVCRLHLGLLRGALAASGAALEVNALEPFVQPDLCVAHLAPSRDA